MEEQRKKEQEFVNWLNEKIDDKTLDYYCKESAWTVKKAAALMLGKYPERLNNESVEKIKDYYSINPESRILIKKYSEYNQLIECAIANEDISKGSIVEYDSIGRNIGGLVDFLENAVIPLSLVNWVKKKCIELPEGLEKLVKKYNPEFVDYEALYKESLLTTEKLQKESLSTIERLEAEIAELIKKANQNVSLRRMKSLETALIAELATHYGADKIQNREVSYSKIAKSWALQVEPLNHETVKALIDTSIHHLLSKK